MLLHLAQYDGQRVYFGLSLFFIEKEPLQGKTLVFQQRQDDDNNIILSTDSEVFFHFYFSTIFIFIQ